VPIISVRLPIARNLSASQAAQILGLALTGVLLVGLIVRPTISLHVLWDMVIPLLPAVFLINPMAWRNVCPLATINAFAGRRGMQQSLDVKQLHMAWGVGIGLLVLLVPARRFLFNADGTVLATTIVLVACAAAIAGVVFERRVAFCNGVCPVLPVEKLYGQSPLLRLGSARCSECSACTAAACLDVAGDKAVIQTLGDSRRSARWITSAFGLFALAFPGFVVGYFTTDNGGLGTALLVYGHVALWATASLLVLGATVWRLHVSARTALPMLGALSFATYYWFAATKLAGAYGGGARGAWGVRAVTALLLALWLWRWQHGARRSPSLTQLKRS
jgi:nitrite reductase (NADH) large subunit